MGGHRNSPVIGNNGLMTEPGDNAKYLRISMELAALPNIDLHDAEQVKERVMQYFKIHADADMKPTVAGLGLALNGMDRRRLWEIKTGSYHTSKELESLPFEVTDLIKKAYKTMENLWENYMQNGKINPVSGIFLGKNNFGYVDKTEHVVTPTMQQDSDYNADEIRNRYITDSPTIIAEADSNSADDS